MKQTLTTTLLLFFIISSFAQELYSDKRILKLMGCRFEITATAVNTEIARNAVDAGIAEISRIEQEISEWIDSSQTSEINQMAGIHPVKVNKELFDLTVRSLKISDLTDGAFDISFASMERIWIFDKQEHLLPDSNAVRKAVQLVNYRLIQMNRDSSTIYLPVKGMKIGFGGIGKGMAANKAMAVMKQIPGVKGGVVNASGDIMAWGESNHPDGWSVQIADPKNHEKPLGWLKLNNFAIVTSGDYEKFFTCGNTRYSHIINPVTGYPVTEVKSATILCPDAEIADALATSVCVLGTEKGLALINQLNGVECLIIDKDDHLHQSDNLQLNRY